MKRLTLILFFLFAACGPVQPASRLALATPTANANDIQLSGGNYGSYTLSQSGSAADPIVVWGNGSTLQCVLITGSYIVWRDTTVTGCSSFGIRATGRSVTIENNTVTDTARSNWDGSKCSGAGSWASAIRTGDAFDVVIRGNKVFRNCGEGIGILRTTGALVEGNIIYDNFSVNIYIDQSPFSTVRNNWSYSTGDTRFYKNGLVARGISIGAELYSGWAFAVHDYLIEGNTLERVRGINYITEQTGTPTNISVRDNRFIGVSAPLVNLGTWATVTGNISVTATPGGTAVTMTPSLTPTPRPPTSTATPTVSPTATSAPAMECYEVIRASGEHVRICFYR